MATSASPDKKKSYLPPVDRSKELILKKKTVPELKEILEREKSLLKKSFVERLADKGEKIKGRIREVEEELARRDPTLVPSTLQLMREAEKKVGSQEANGEMENSQGSEFKDKGEPKPVLVPLSMQESICLGAKLGEKEKALQEASAKRQSERANSGFMAAISARPPQIQLEEENVVREEVEEEDTESESALSDIAEEDEEEFKDKENQLRLDSDDSEDELSNLVQKIVKL